MGPLSMYEKKREDETEEQHFNRLYEKYSRRWHPLVAAIEAHNCVVTDREARKRNG